MGTLCRTIGSVHVAWLLLLLLQLLWWRLHRLYSCDCTHGWVYRICCRMDVHGCGGVVFGTTCSSLPGRVLLRWQEGRQDRVRIWVLCCAVYVTTVSRCCWCLRELHHGLQDWLASPAAASHLTDC
jgi:hypothetical protein